MIWRYKYVYIIITFMRICKYYFTHIQIMSFIHHYHKMKNADIVHIHLHHTIIICVIQTAQKIYNKLTSFHYELPNNLHIYYRTSNYTEMKRYLNDHHTSEYLQMILCMYNTNHMYYSPE